jgi:uncharacterized protein YigA (DUF484 family)
VSNPMGNDGSAAAGEGTAGITEQDIANFLANNPGFFERHAELLATIQLSHPHGLRAVSLQERQMRCCATRSRAWSTRSSR